MGRAPLAESLDWNLVRSFIAVVETGSLAGAARTLGLAHPTVARHIQQLEQALGMNLFDRRPTGLALNRAGARLAASARGMRDSARIFEQVTAAVRAAGSGIVRIVVPDTLASVLPRLLGPLRDREREGLIQLDLLISRDDASLIQQSADMAIRHSQPEQQDLICRRLAPLPFALYASTDYVHARGMPVLAELDRHRYIDAVSEPVFIRNAARMGYSLAREQFVLRSDAFAGRLQATLAGWGIAALPMHVAEASPGLVRVFADVNLEPVDLWLAARPEVRSVAYLYEAFMTLADVLNNFVGARDAAQSRTTRPNRAVTA